jgi:hypothetical protein
MPEPKLGSYNPGSKHEVTIASGASLSNAAAIPPSHTLVGILMPAAWDAASLTFQGSWDGTNYGNAHSDDGVEVAELAGHVRGGSKKWEWMMMSLRNAATYAR